MKDGKQRVIIENVQPIVDGGSYPAKRTVGERVDVTAHIFGDGHDHIRAHLYFRKKGERQVYTVEMKANVNDEWMGSFYVKEEGVYLFTVSAWVDHLETWYDGIKKKIAAKVDVHLELLEGAEFLGLLSSKDPRVSVYADQLSDQQHMVQAIDMVMSHDFEEVIKEHPFIRNETRLSQEFEVVVEQKKSLFSAWYELFPRSSALEDRHGTFQDCIKLLPRIKTMGFDVLYFPPIHPIGKKNRKGKNNSVRSGPGEPGSPWAIGSEEGGHKAILKELGSMEDYELLIAEASKLGIDIALDLAFQCAPDHPYVKEHPDWFKQRPDGSIQYAENPPKKYQDIYPFNFETDDWKALWEELKSVVEFWIEHGVRIFRVDNPHTKPIPFWQWLIAEINKKHKGIIFLAEAFTRPKIMASLAKVGFNQSYTYFTWRVSKQEIMEYMNELVNGPSRNYFRPNFWPNTPDILPWHLQHQSENVFILRFAMAATLSASYGIYGPPYEFYENVPVEGKEEYLNSEKYEIKKYDWKRTNRMTDIITLVNQIRKDNPALHETWNLQFCQIENPNLLAYVKATDDLSNILLIVINLDPNSSHSGYVQLPRQRLGLGEKINIKLHDLMTDEHYTWTQEWNYLEINPFKMPFHLFKLDIRESNM